MRFAPPKGFPSRPTTDYAKEGLFNLLENNITLQDLSILDLCAGTGNITLELASREAGKIVCVDKHPVCTRFIHQQVEKLKLEKIVSVVKMDIFVFLSRTIHKYDFIFCDPPYDFRNHGDVLKWTFERELLLEGGMLIIEHGKQTDLSKYPNWKSTRNFGNVYFSFFASI
jgi:16S rRNA (guanine966-N2)-methyltransferase